MNGIDNSNNILLVIVKIFSEKLGDLRNQWLMVFAVSNTLWLILISTLANQGKLLNVFGSNVMGMSCHCMQNKTSTSMNVVMPKIKSYKSIFSYLLDFSQ